MSRRCLAADGQSVSLTDWQCRFVRLLAIKGRLHIPKIVDALWPDCSAMVDPHRATIAQVSILRRRMKGFPLMVLTQQPSWYYLLSEPVTILNDNASLIIPSHLVPDLRAAVMASPKPSRSILDLFG